MAKIFQLELFIKEMSIWKLPHASEEHDETCVEVTVFDQRNVPINGYVFGKNSTMNRGQNFLFTLNVMPSDENKVFFNVFKRAYNREKNFWGSGNIPIDKIFGDLLSKVLKDATKTTPNQSIAIVSSANDLKLESVTPTNPAKKNTSRTKANTPESSKEDPQSGQQNTDASKKNPKAVNQKQTPNNSGDNIASTKEPKAAIQGTSKQSLKGAVQIASAQKQDAAILGSTHNTLVVEQNTTKSQGGPQANISPIKNLKTVNIASSVQGSPISSLSKDVYPILLVAIRSNGARFAFNATDMLRLFQCPSDTNTNTNHKEIILQNTPNSAAYKCVPLDDLKVNNRKDIRNRKQRLPNNYCTDVSKTRNSSNTSIRSSSSSCSRSSSTNTAQTYSNLCPVPPGSPSGQYEEFTAEINDNTLCVRMPKNAGIVKRVYDNEPSKRIGSLHGCSDHVRKIPVIRGNRKYPAHYGSMLSLPSGGDRNISIYDQQQRTKKDYSIHRNENESRICEDNDIFSCPSNVQIVRTNTDPKRDVFLLKIGTDAQSGSGIQLEMKTPKNPLARSSTNKQTTSVQTYDDEFVGGIKKGGGKGGKKGGKKGKK